MRSQLFKPVLMALLTFVVSNSCFAQLQYSYTLKSWNIKGKVDSIVQNEIKIIKNDSVNTIIDTRAVYFYDKTGHLVQEHYHDYAARKQFRLKDTLPLRTVRNYDNKGNLVEKVNYDSGGAPGYKDVYTLDPSASFIDVKSYYEPNKALVTIAKLLLDKKGNVIDASSYITRGKLVYKHKYKYDDDNRCIEDIEVSAETLKEYKSIFTYNNGDVIKKIDYNELGEKQTTYTYNYPRYDKKHNWLVRKMYFNGRLSQIYERTIIYRK